MILDKQNLFSNDQAITSDAVSTNVVDLGAVSSDAPTPSLRAGVDANLVFQVNSRLEETGTSAAITSMAVSLQSCATEGFGTVKTHWSQTLLGSASQLDAGARIIMPIPEDVGRFLRLNYDVTGTPDTGTVTAGITFDSPTMV